MGKGFPGCAANEVSTELRDSTAYSCFRAFSHIKDKQLSGLHMPSNPFFLPWKSLSTKCFYKHTIG